MDNVIFSIIIFGAGFFSILASVLNWDFFFENRKAQWALKVFGRNGARIFYVVLGIVIIFLGFMSMEG